MQLIAVELIAARAQLVSAKGQNVAKKTGQDIPSPCISVCQMSPGTDLCAGCWRTLDEIASWSRASDADKHAIWERIARRIEQSTGSTP